MTPHLRRATESDAPRVAEVMIASRNAAPIPPSLHSDAEVREWVSTTVLPDYDAWVACVGMEVVGLAVLSPGWIEHLYVAPSWWGRGVGALLVQNAKSISPDGLQLWTFVSNVPAQRFYERLGFIEIERTDGSANEERSPDIRYSWTPSAKYQARESAQASC